MGTGLPGGLLGHMVGALVWVLVVAFWEGFVRVLFSQFSRLQCIGGGCHSLDYLFAVLLTETLEVASFLNALLANTKGVCVGGGGGWGTITLTSIWLLWPSQWAAFF